MIKLRMRKDRLVTEDGVHYVAYGVNVYQGIHRVCIIKDVSLDKARLKEFIRLCNKKRFCLDNINDLIYDFVEEENMVKI